MTWLSWITQNTLDLTAQQRGTRTKTKENDLEEENTGVAAEVGDPELVSS